MFVCEENQPREDSFVVVVLSRYYPVLPYRQNADAELAAAVPAPLGWVCDRPEIRNLRRRYRHPHPPRDRHKNPPRTFRSRLQRSCPLRDLLQVGLRCLLRFRLSSFFSSLYCSALSRWRLRILKKHSSSLNESSLVHRRYV